MSNHYTLTVPVTYKDGNGTKTSFQRVGAMFRNQRTNGGEEFFSIKLDFPVAVSELVAFPANSKTPED